MNQFQNKGKSQKEVLGNLKKLLILTLFILILLCTNCSPNRPSIPDANVLPYFVGKDFDPLWYQKDAPKVDAKKIPETLELTSEFGETVKATDWKHKTKVVVFFYATCKGICPMITRSLIQNAPKIVEFPNTYMYSITINPKEDNVNVLKNYKKQYKIESRNWNFFTGEETEILSFAKDTCGGQVEVYSSLKDRFDFVHTENVFLFDENNYLRGVYRAKGSGDLERLNQDLTKLHRP